MLADEHFIRYVSDDEFNCLAVFCGYDDLVPRLYCFINKIGQWLDVMRRYATETQSDYRKHGQFACLVAWAQFTVHPGFERVDAARGADRLAEFPADDVQKLIVPSITGNAYERVCAGIDKLTIQPEQIAYNDRSNIKDRVETGIAAKFVSGSFAWIEP